MDKNFEDKYFRKFKFTDKQIRKYFNNATKDFKIAKEDQHLEVKFTYSYSSLIKSAMAIIAKIGFKVRSVPGHHVKLIEKLSDLLEDETIFEMGNAMRMKRNEDFYGEGIYVSEKEATEFLLFVEDVIHTVQKKLNS